MREGRRVTEAKLLRAKELRRDMTPHERLLWGYLRRNRLDDLHVRRQHVLDGFILDFFCAEARVAIELDGGIHDEQAEYDAERDAILSANGIHVLRITNEMSTRDLSGTLRLIAQTCRSRLD